MAKTNALLAVLVFLGSAFAQSKPQAHALVSTNFSKAAIKLLATVKKHASL